MATIKYSPIVTAAAGKAGGTIFAKNKSASYIRGWAKPSNPRTTRQISQRNVLANVTSAYRGLTQAQRDAWDAAANWRTFQNKMGETKTYTGAQLFIAQNLALAPITMTTLVAPTLPLETPSYIISAATLIAGELVVDVDREDGGNALPATTDYLVMEVSLPTPPGQNPTQFRQVGALNSLNPRVEVDATQAIITLTAAQLAAVIGTPAVGTQVAVRVRPLNANDPWEKINNMLLVSSVS